MITTTIVKEDLRKYNGYSERQLFNSLPRSPFPKISQDLG
jgi:hypothetical protein